MTLKYARAMAGMTTWASHSREDVDTALAIVTRALDGAEAERDAYLGGWVGILNAIDDALGAANQHETECERLNDELNGTIQLGNQAREQLHTLRQSQDADTLAYQHALAEKDGAYDVLLAHANGLECDNAALKARTCATCRHATHGDVDLCYLWCARWSSPNPPFSDVMCADILTCGAWSPLEMTHETR